MGHTIKVDPTTLHGMTSVATTDNDVGIVFHPPIESKLESPHVQYDSNRHRHRLLVHPRAGADPKLGNNLRVL